MSEYAKPVVEPKIDPMKVSPRKRLAMGYTLDGKKKSKQTNTKEPKH